MSVNINLDLSSKTDHVNNFFNHVHFHPTDAIEDDWGKKIIDRMAEDKSVKRIRVYTMFEDIVSVGSKGELVYDYSLCDLRYDYLVSHGFSLLICFNFMPPDIAENPDAVSHIERYKGKQICFSRPRDYALWEEICRHFAEHLINRYGIERVQSWYFHCWNEPDHHYWINNTPCTQFSLEKAEEYVKLYDYFVSGIKKANPNLKVGGPSAAGHIQFMEYFFNHITHEPNFKTGKIGTELNFFAMHTYNTLSPTNPAVKAKIDTVYKYVDLLKKYSLEKTEIVIDEWGAMVNGFTSFKEKPILEIREKTYLSAYFAKFIDEFSKEIKFNNLNLSFAMFCLSGQHTSTYDFDGYRSFFTLNGFAKPIYNAYHMCSKLGEEHFSVTPDDPTVGCVATKTQNGYSVLIYNFTDDTALSVPTKDVNLNFSNIFGDAQITTYIIDSTHSSGYDEYIRMNKPENLTKEQIDSLMKSSALYSTSKNVALNKTYSMSFSLEQNASVLIEIKQ